MPLSDKEIEAVLEQATKNGKALNRGLPSDVDEAAEYVLLYEMPQIIAEAIKSGNTQACIFGQVEFGCTNSFFYREVADKIVERLTKVGRKARVSAGSAYLGAFVEKPAICVYLVL